MHSVETFRPWARDAIVKLRERGFKFTPANWFARDLETEKLCGGCLLFGLGMMKSNMNMLEYKRFLVDHPNRGRGYHGIVANQLEITSSQALDLSEMFDWVREKYESRQQSEESFRAFIAARNQPGGLGATAWYELGWELRNQALL